MPYIKQVGVLYPDYKICSAFKTGALLDNLHNLLKDEDGDGTPDLDGSKRVIEMSQRFHKKPNYWQTYMMKTVLELLMALALFAWMVVVGLIPRLFTIDNVIPCKVYGTWFECSGHSEEVSGKLWIR